MRNLISIYKIVEKIDRGVPITIPKLKMEVNGVIDLISGGKGQQAMKNVPESTHILMCRYVCDVKSGDLVICNNDTSNVYEVTFVDNPMNRFRNLEVELKFMPEIKLELVEEEGDNFDIDE